MGTLPLKKVNNADSGDADHVGGNDWDDLSDYLNNIDKTGPVVIDTLTHYRSGKGGITNPANTFKYNFVGSAIAANRDITFPLITGTDTLTTLGLAQTFTAVKTFNNQTIKLRNPANTFDLTLKHPVITANYNTELIDGAEFLVYKDSSSNFVAKRHNWALESSNSDALTVLQYAVDNSHNKGAILIKGETGTNYDLSDSLSLVDKNVYLCGISSARDAQKVGVGTSHRGGVVLRKNYVGTDPLIDCHNTAFSANQIANMTLIGDDTASSVGIDAFDVTSRAAFLSNVKVTNFGTGLLLSKCWYTDFNQIMLENNDLGLQLSGTGSPTNADNNTQRYFGGRISGNKTNVKFLYANDIMFFGTTMEGKSSGHVYSVDSSTNNGQNKITFIGCSFEKSDETGSTIVYENGNNNTYYNCRFSSNANQIMIRVGTNAKNINIYNNYFQHGAATTYDIQVDSGAQDTKVMFNTKSTNAVGTVTLTNNGTRTWALGNSGITNIIPEALQFDDYQDLKVISAPASPAANYGRVYAKQIDSNNDGLFVKIKLNNSFQEVRIA